MVERASDGSFSAERLKGWCVMRPARCWLCVNVSTTLFKCASAPTEEPDALEFLQRYGNDYRRRVESEDRQGRRFCPRRNAPEGNVCARAFTRRDQHSARVVPISKCARVRGGEGRMDQ